jgi:thioredoxin-dependent peroxiredoxin
MINLNDKAPTFVLENQNGKKISLKDFAGKWLVLYFYPMDNTPGCTKEACDFTEGIKSFEKLNTKVLGVSPDSITSHQKFIKGHALKIDLLSDPDKKVMAAYGAYGAKKTLGIKYHGVIRSTFIISPEGKIAALWYQVKVRVKKKGEKISHSDIVQEKLLELQKA